MTGKLSMGKTALTILLVTIFVLSFAFQVSAAGSVYYYEVQSGDFLWLIGWRFETTADQIMSYNGLKNANIFPGQALIIPPSTGYVRKLPQLVAYNVKKGDTLDIIAQKFGTTVTKIKNSNQLTSNTIWAGSTLYVPLPPQKRYTVQAGDSLYLTARKFGCTIESLMLVNKMNTQMLWVGQVLFVPDSSLTGSSGSTPPVEAVTSTPSRGGSPDRTLPPLGNIDFSKPLPKIGQWGQIPSGVVLYHVQLGENLWEIAERYKTSIYAIMKTNRLSSDLIQVNQPLFIPQNSITPVTLTGPSGTQKQGYGELMDWEYVSWLADTHSVFTIKDISTGKSFNVRRYGGSNHVDAEPLTAVDSAIMKDVFGQWSWNKRSVLVYVDGKTLAGSMAGMPHSFDSIPENNFAGHFDLYFLNSRTHKDNTIVADHQKNVLLAAGVN